MIANARDHRLDELAALPDGWLDGFGRRIEPPMVDQARQLLAALSARQIADPSIYPTPNGGIQLEWAYPGGGTTIEIVTPDRRMDLCTYDTESAGGVESTFPLDQVDAAVDAVRKLCQGGA